MRQAFSRLISLRSFAPVQASLVQPSAVVCASSSAVGPALSHAALQQQLHAEQRRGVISVPVQNNKLSRAMRNMSRTIFGDQLLKEWRGREFFVKPAKQRFVAKKETKVRLRKAEFREKLRWAMQRKARCAL